MVGGEKDAKDASADGTTGADGKKEKKKEEEEIEIKSSFYLYNGIRLHMGRNPTF